MDKAYVLGVLDQFSYFYGDIDNITKTGLDNFKQMINNAFPIDLINLDYCNGLDYQSFSKLTTLEAIISKQKEALISKKLPFPYFILLLTHNIPLHEGDATTKINYLNFLTREISFYEKAIKDQIQKSFEWYISPHCPPAYQHKCFVIGKTIEYAQANGFKATPHKVFQYQGDKDATMMHYQFQITPINLKSLVPPQNKMNVVQIMNHPVINEEENNISSDCPIIRL